MSAKGIRPIPPFHLRKPVNAIPGGHELVRRDNRYSPYLLEECLERTSESK